MKVVDLIKRLQSYPMDASVSIEGDMLRVAGYISCSPAYISLKDIVSKKFPLSKEKKRCSFRSIEFIT